MNPLDKIPLDKSHHFIAGAIIASVFALAWGKLHLLFLLPWQAAMLFPLLAGMGKEAVDYALNWKAKKTAEEKGIVRGDVILPHGVEWWDVAATALGGVVVGLPLI